MTDHDHFTLPAGYGMRRLSVSEFHHLGQGLDGLMDHLLVFEPPRRKPQHRQFRYVIGVDVSDGIGGDRSVADVLRFPTLDEPIEQVAQYVTTSTSPADFAPIIDSIGRWYADEDGYEALVTVEINNHGLSTQDLLQKHYGYTHLYRWQYADKASLDRRFSQAIGWVTNQNSRKVLLSSGLNALRQFDPVTGTPNLIIHSPFTYADLADFSSPTGFLADAEATSGNYDDCVMSLFIANISIEQALIGEAEPLADRRHRLQLERAARDRAATHSRDWRNTDASAQEANLGLLDGDLGILTEDEVQELAEGLYYADDRA